METGILHGSQKHQTLSGDFFLSFHYSHIRQNTPNTEHFRPINMAWRNLSAKLFENRPDTFGVKDFQSFHYSHIRRNSPAPWWPCFSINHHGSKESDRGSSKEQFYKIIWKFANQFGRRILKFCFFKEFWWGHWVSRGCFLWSFIPIDPLVT